jgi:hypothetical protein
MGVIRQYELEDFESNTVHFRVDTSKCNDELVHELASFFDVESSIEAILEIGFVTVINMMRRKGWEVIDRDSAEEFTALFHTEEGWLESGVSVTYVSALPIDTDAITVRRVS